MPSKHFYFIIGKNDFLHSTKATIKMRYKELRTKRALSSKVDPYIDGLQAMGDHLLLKGLPRKKKEKLF